MIQYVLWLMTNRKVVQRCVKVWCGRILRLLTTTLLEIYCWVFYNRSQFGKARDKCTVAPFCRTQGMSSTLVYRCDLCAWRRDQKRQRKKLYCGKLSICPDHRWSSDRNQILHGARVVLCFKFRQNQLSLNGFRDTGSKFTLFCCFGHFDLYSRLYFTGH